MFGIELNNHRELSRSLRDFQPDVVQWWVMGGLSISLIRHAAKLGYKCQLRVCDYWPSYGPQVDPVYRGLAGRPRLRRALRWSRYLPASDDWISRCAWSFNSVALQRAISDELPIPPQQATVVPSPVAGVFHPRDRITSRTGPRLGTVGRVGLDKGTDIALHALRFCPDDAYLTILGSNTGDLDLEELSRKLGVSQRYDVTGWLPRSEVANRLSQLDVLLFPIRWNEPHGLAPLEAMASGVPVVLVARGGTAAFARHEDNCLVVPADDPQAVGRAVRRLLAEPQLRDRLVAQGLRTAAEFSERRCNTQILDHLLQAAVR
jgi:glycosyltransferase involved in cell wall biosynthesis